ncbi:MAG: GTPase, partial [Patescibacteria group bacterium]
MENGKKYYKFIVLGAGGRDFFNFLRFYKHLSFYKVVAFVVTQIPGIDNRIFPERLAGQYYPEGIPIYSIDKLEELIINEWKKADTKEVFVELAYSDISEMEISLMKNRIESHGAIFIAPTEEYYKEVVIESSHPVIAVTAVRTGCGKSPVTRYIARHLKDRGFNPVIVRHPMPYGDFIPTNDAQRFASYE